METFIILALTLLFVLTVIHALIDVKNNKALSKRAKANWNFFIVLVPGTGALIYFLYKIFVRENIKGNLSNS